MDEREHELLLETAQSEKAQEFASAYGNSLPFVDNGQASIQDSQPMLPILGAFKPCEIGVGKREQALYPRKWHSHFDMFGLLPHTERRRRSLIRLVADPRCRRPWPSPRFTLTGRHAWDYFDDISSTQRTDPWALAKVALRLSTPAMRMIIGR